jgi:hypothetical protein
VPIQLGGRSGSHYLGKRINRDILSIMLFSQMEKYYKVCSLCGEFSKEYHIVKEKIR